MLDIIKGNQNTTKLMQELKRSVKQYPCLNKAQELEMIEKNKNNPDKLRHLLFMHNIGLVFNTAKQYMSKTDDFDSMVQDGMVGLGEAVKRFDINKGIKFCTYATQWVRKYVLAKFYTRQYEQDKVTVSLDAPAPSVDDEESCLADYVNEKIDPSELNCHESVHDTLSSDEKRDICSDLYNRLESDASLSSTEKAVFVDMFYNKERTRDIAEKFDISSDRVFEIRDKVLAKMRYVLQNEYRINSYTEIG